jgi:WD40 repeat protein
MRLKHNEQVRGIAYSPDGTRIATASYDSMVRIWDAATGDELLRLGGHQNAVHCVAFAPSGTSLASGSYGRTARIWDACSTNEIARISGYKGEVSAIAVSPDGLKVAAGGPSDPVRVFAGHSGKLIQDLSHIFRAVQRLEFDCTGRLLLGVTIDGAAVVASVAERKEVSRFPAPPNKRNPAAFGSDGTSIVTAGVDGVVRLCDTLTGNVARDFPNSEQAIWDIALSRDGKFLAAVDVAGIVRVMQVANPTVGASCFDSGLGQVGRLAFHPHDNRLAIAGCDKIHDLLFWEPMSDGSWRMVLRVTTHEDKIWDIAYTSDGERIATACRDRFIRIFDTRSGIITAEYDMPQQVQAVGIDPAGTFVVAGGRNGMLRMADSVFGASFTSHRLAAVVARHRLLGAERLTPPEIERINQFADAPGDGWPNLSQRVAELYPGIDKSEDQLVEVWRRHREVAFRLERDTLTQGDLA